MRRVRSGRSAVLAVAVAVGTVGLAACVPVKGPAAEPPIITTTPALIPGFQLGVVDYANRCDPAAPTQVQVTAGQGTTVSVNGGPALSGTFAVQVTQAEGQRFTIEVTLDGTTTTHHVRCVPTDFPNWTPEPTGGSQSAFYASTLVQGFATPAYSAVFDANGVPVWWLDRKSTFLLAPLPNKHFAILKIGGNGGMEEYDVDGQLVRSVNAVGGPTDFHDVLLLPNGNYVLATIQPDTCILPPTWGLGVTPKTCLNHVFQEIDPDNPTVPVWTWDTATHIPITETTDNWRAEQTSQTRSQYDPWHYNSVEDTGDGFIISFRHLDAVYKINKTTGLIEWKLGGTARPESLAIQNDPFTGIAGQHDARLLGDGTLTLFDNGTLGLNTPRQPRDVRYALDLDPEARTATLLHQLQDADVSTSGCCGSARLLSGGDWVTGWGGNNNFAEHTFFGTRVFRLFGTFVYRALPLLPGEFSADEFRAGMDAQFAAGVTAQAAEPAADLENSPHGTSIESMQCCL